MQRESILLVSCYELGHQPSGVAVPAGFFRRAGIDVEAMDVSVEGFDEEKIARARFIGISVPMHTALRLGLRVAEAARRTNAEAHICFYGLYASLNRDYLLDTVADSVIGGEVETSLVQLVQSLDMGVEIDLPGASTRSQRTSSPVLARLSFAAPAREQLPPIEKYARLDDNGHHRLVGYVEASRGCLHNCTHCPIPPVYGGRFFVVPQDVVLADIRGLVGSGARHITFGDPDFLNGPTHALRLAREMHKEFPDLTFDLTAKVEHILKYSEIFPELGRAGCVFVVSALESLSDVVLKHLEKGHARRDIYAALAVLKDAGIALRPSFVSFTPWTTLADYIDMLEFVEAEGLIDNVDPVQYTIRLLVPPGSLLLERKGTAAWLGPLAQESFTYEWAHTDAAMDRLWGDVSVLVEQGVRRNQDSAAIFYKTKELAYVARGDRRGAREMPVIDPGRVRPPRLTEAWFC
ncbi:MAG TPA: CUAEP/CCAEP-tail radical SAM protein [Blastocatellia bacterium]|nr:CUAEP/CCAEP-tail radical SAM protein [Blastocatellia bacterium]